MTEQWQELKETIIEMRDNDGTCTQQEVCKFLVNMMDVLEKQMSDGWIPVDEKLPKNIGYYLVTYDYGKYDLATSTHYWHGERIGWNETCGEIIVAWMPLPEPYKIESKE